MSTAPAMGWRFRLGAVIAIAVAAGFATWLLLRNGNASDSSSSSPSSVTQTRRAGAHAVSPNGLRRLAATVDHPVFWLGRKPGYTYELTKTTNGQIYVRYLPGGVAVGADKPYLTVATYPFPGAFAAIRKQAAARGAATVKLAHGGIAVLDQAYPESVHLAYPGVNYQVEVYDPTPARAMQLVSAGQLAVLGKVGQSQTTSPTSASANGTPTAASQSDLSAVAASIGHPIYWVGASKDDTYELTRTTNDKVYIRYLPRGVAVGAPHADYLTVATYPFPNAFAAIEREAGATGEATIKLPHGGLAVIDSSYPESIHLAWPGVDYQVEVFDPSPSKARQTVAAGRVVAIG